MIQTKVRDKTKMLTIPQLIALGYLSARGTRRLIDENKVPHIKVGTRRYISLAVFEQYLETGEVQ